MGQSGTEPPQPQVADPAAANIHAIIDLERQAGRDASRSERVSERISGFIGSLGFVLVHVCWFIAWAAWNRFAAEPLRFDPYPYGLLTFIVSMEAVLISTFVLITQNRMSRQSDERDHLNLQIDMLAEQEMTLMLRMLRRICERLDIPAEGDEEARAQKLTEQTNVYQLVQTLRNEMPERQKK